MGLHKKFGPDQFSRFDVYGIQTNKQTDTLTPRQAKFIYRLHFSGAVSSQSRHMVLPPDFEYNLNPNYGPFHGPYQEPFRGPYHKPYYGPYYPPYQRPNYGPHNGPSYGPYPNHIPPPAPPFPVYGSAKLSPTRNFLPPTIEELEKGEKEKLKNSSDLTSSTVISVTTTTTVTTPAVGNGNIIGRCTVKL